MILQKSCGFLTNRERPRKAVFLHACKDLMYSFGVTPYFARKER